MNFHFLYVRNITKLDFFINQLHDLNNYLNGKHTNIIAELLPFDGKSESVR